MRCKSFKKLLNDTRVAKGLNKQQTDANLDQIDT